MPASTVGDTLIKVKKISRLNFTNYWRNDHLEGRESGAGSDDDEQIMSSRFEDDD